MIILSWVGGWKIQRYQGVLTLREHPILESPLRFEQRTDKETSQGLTPVTSSEFPYPAAAPLCLTRVKFPGTKAYSLIVRHRKLIDNSLPLQSAYL